MEGRFVDPGRGRPQLQLPLSGSCGSGSVPVVHPSVSIPPARGSVEGPSSPGFSPTLPGVERLSPAMHSVHSMMSPLSPTRPVNGAFVYYADPSRAALYDPSLLHDSVVGPVRRTVSQYKMMSKMIKKGEDSSESTQTSESDEKEVAGQNGVFRGMHAWNPELYHWFASRMGTKTKAFLIGSFVSFEAMKFLLAEHAYVDGVNTFSILVVTNLTSLIFALWMSIFLEGGEVIDRILKWEPLFRFMLIAVLFTVASVLVLCAYRIGTAPAEVVTIGYIYMPISAVLSYYVFRRRYGILEWLSIGMMTLAILAFVLLREESKGHKLNFSLSGGCLVVSAVAISVLASILAERVFKARNMGLRRQRPGKQDKFYIMKVHLDFSSLVVSVCLWMARTSALGDFFEQWSHSKDWFGNWGRYQFVMVFVAVCQGWAAGLVTKEFSTVIKAIAQTLSVVMMMLLGDKFMGDRFHFQAREVPSVLLATVTVMSAVIFQTGRLNLKELRKAAKLGPEAQPQFEMSALPGPENDSQSPRAAKDSHANGSTGAHSSRSEESEEEGVSEENSRSDRPLLDSFAIHPKVPIHNWVKTCETYALILVYIITDAGRTIILQKSLQSTVTNSVSMGIAIYSCGVLVASVLSFYTHGCKGVGEAWSLPKIFRCLPAAFLFSLATVLANLAFSQGISSALYVVLGKFYTPVAAIAARWIMGKFYMWLEWFALLILTLACMAFGYLQAYGIDEQARAPIPAMLLVLGSAATSALASLVTEKILKEKKKGEKVPFHIQKVRLDAGSILSSLAMLPVLGMVASRPQDILWAERPVDAHECPWDSVCWDNPQHWPWGSTSGHTCGNVGCECECVEGLFAGWNSPVLALAVLINAAQGWLVGRVTQRFSVVHRAIADSFSLLAIYFIGDPIFNGTSLSNVTLNLVAFIVPLSTATFSVATSEMQKVFNARSKLEDQGRSRAYTTDSESEESELSAGMSRNNSVNDRSTIGSSRSRSPSRERDSPSRDGGMSPLHDSPFRTERLTRDPI